MGAKLSLVLRNLLNAIFGIDTFTPDKAVKPQPRKRLVLEPSGISDTEPGSGAVSERAASASKVRAGVHYPPLGGLAAFPAPRQQRTLYMVVGGTHQSAEDVPLVQEESTSRYDLSPAFDVPGDRRPWWEVEAERVVREAEKLSNTTQGLSLHLLRLRLQESDGLEDDIPASEPTPEPTPEAAPAPAPEPVEDSGGPTIGRGWPMTKPGEFGGDEEDDLDGYVAKSPYGVRSPARRRVA